VALALFLLRKALRIVRDNGFASLARRTYSFCRRKGWRYLSTGFDLEQRYRLWLKRTKGYASHPVPGELRYRPLISVVMPVCDPDPRWLAAAIESVLNQSYENWELCIADDCSRRADVRHLLEECASSDERVKVAFLPSRRGISGATNAAVGLSRGEFVGFLDHDDVLAPHALWAVARLLNEWPDLDMVYSDEDKIDPGGQRSEPFFKPDLSPDLLMSTNYITHFLVVRRAVLEDVGGLDPQFDGSQDYDLVLRIVERTRAVGHVADILYHWRRVPGSTSCDAGAKPYAFPAAMKALQAAALRQGFPAEVTMIAPGRYRVAYAVKGTPKVSVIIPTRDKVELLRRCIASLFERTSYRPFEVIVVDNRTRDPEALRYLEELREKKLVRVVPFDEEFNFSKLNNLAAKGADGDHIVFLNNDTEIVTGEWLEELLGHSQRPRVGAVGCRLVFPDGRIQHGGIVFGPDGVITHAFYRLADTDPGYMGLATVVRNCAAVTAACMMIKRSLFEEVGGFDENLRVSYGDVDLCFRLLRAGYFNVWTPHATLLHRESATRGEYQPTEDVRYFREKWRSFLDAGDPFYNANLEVVSGRYRLKLG